MHAGGAFQISQNFLLKSLEHADVEWYYVTSNDVDDAIGDKFRFIRDKRYFVFPTQPDFKNTYKQVKKQLRELECQINPDVVYSITAPSYFTFKVPEVMRFTNPWVTHPNKYSWSVLSLKERIYYYLYGLNQKRMMKVAHYFITQTKTCAEGIRRVTGEPEEHVKVVHNVLPAIFKQVENTPIVEDEYINIACVGAATTHKNFDIIPDVIKELDDLGINNVRIHVTLPSDEPTLGKVSAKLKKYGLNERLINHGRLAQKDLAEMYRRCQFCFLPTLLEVFSASTVEAMYFNLSIVATNFPFNTEVLADACLYYEPKNAKDAAKQFAKLIADKELQATMRERMARQLTIYGDYDAHFNAIKDYLIKVAKRDV